MQMRIRKLGLSFDPLKKIFQDVFGLLGTLANAAVPVLYNLAAVIVAAFKPIQAFLSPVIEALKPIIEDVFSFAADMIGALVPIVQGLTPYFEKLGEAVAQLVNKLRPILQNIMNAIKAAFEPIKAFVVPIIEGLKPVVQDVFGMIGRLLDLIGKKTTGMGDSIRGLTPLFSALGTFIGNTIAPVLKLALALKGVTTALSIGKKAVGAVNAAMNIGQGMSALFSGNLLKMSMNLRAAGIGQNAINRIAETFGLLTGKVDLATAAANKNKLAMVALRLQTIKTTIATKAKAAADRIAAVAAKAWDIGKQTAMLIAQKVVLIGQKIATLAVAAAQKVAALASKVWAAAQGVLNAIMAANPIGLIIVGIIALIVAIGLLVKNWDKVKTAIVAGAKAIAGFFQKMWKTIVGFFKK
jgi:phage-related protein